MILKGKPYRLTRRELRFGAAGIAMLVLAILAALL